MNTKVWAHRGASGYAPENTLEAFELAAKQKADGVELDVQLSKDGELVVFYRLDQAYQPGDIVIIHRSDNIEYIKRVVAEPGDTVELSEEGALLVNGEEEEGLAGMGKTLPVQDGVEFPYAVPENCYFVLGDNRENSLDSRSFGVVKEEEITGRVFFHLGMTK